MILAAVTCNSFQQVGSTIDRDATGIFNLVWGLIQPLFYFVRSFAELEQNLRENEILLLKNKQTDKKKMTLTKTSIDSGFVISRISGSQFSDCFI